MMEIKSLSNKSKDISKNKIVCFDNANAYKLYKQGIYPSHFLYGAIEIEKSGYEIVYISKSVQKNPFKRWIENAKSILKEKPDAVFIPFITDKECWLCILKLARVFKCPILGYSHKTISSRLGIRWFKKILYRQFYKVFFISPLNMKSSIYNRLISKNQAILSNWGADLAFYYKFIKNDLPESFFFITTGKENRDFQILIDAFTRTNKKLQIITAPHAGRTYEYLQSYIGKYENIGIELIKNDNNSCINLAYRVANSFCVVIPLIKSEIGYCLGLSSIVEAMALGKPLIATDNPYFPIDIEKENIGLIVDSVDSWIDAINYLHGHPLEAKKMGINARKLAETKYNIELSSNGIIKCLNSILN